MVDSVEALAQETVSRDPQNVTARLVLAELLLLQGRYQEVLNHLNDAMQFHPNDFRVLLTLARVCRDIAEYKTCSMLLERLRGMQPGHPVIDQMYEQVQRVLTEPERTLKANERAQAVFEEYARIGAALASGDEHGITPALSPILIEMNGDLMRVPSDLLKFLWHTYHRVPEAVVPSFLAESWHYYWVRERLKPGDVAFDIGCNIGFFTVMMAKAVGSTGQIHAFEPSPTIAADLRRVLTLNELSNVVVNEWAMSDRAGLATFVNVMAKNVGRESSHLSTQGRDGAAPEAGTQWVTVPTISVDEYVLPRGLRPSVLKIDVEGADMEVLRGGIETLRRHHPPICLEIHYTEEEFFRGLHEFLGGLGYKWRREDKIYFCEV